MDEDLFFQQNLMRKNTTKKAMKMNVLFSNLNLNPSNCKKHMCVYIRFNSTRVRILQTWRRVAEMEVEAAEQHNVAVPRPGLWAHRWRLRTQPRAWTPSYRSKQIELVHWLNRQAAPVQKRN
jgi:hypothetical protein